MKKLCKLLAINFSRNRPHPEFSLKCSSDKRLIDSGCEVWAVSASNHWIIRSAMRSFGIPRTAFLLPKLSSKTASLPIDSYEFRAGPGNRTHFDPSSSRDSIVLLETPFGTAKCWHGPARLCH